MFITSLALLLLILSASMLVIVCTLLVISLRIKTKNFFGLIDYFVDTRVQRRIEEQRQAWLNRKSKV